MTYKPHDWKKYQNHIQDERLMGDRLRRQSVPIDVMLHLWLRGMLPILYQVFNPLP